MHDDPYPAAVVNQSDRIKRVLGGDSYLEELLQQAHHHARRAGDGVLEDKVAHAGIEIRGDQFFTGGLAIADSIGHIRTELLQLTLVQLEFDPRVPEWQAAARALKAAAIRVMEIDT